MGSPDPVLLSPDVGVGQGSHFMRLPTEMREMIYRHLLIARYTVKEHTMTAKEYDANRDRIQNGPDQTYRFYTAILAVSRKIHEEARDLCRRENDFVCLSSRQPSHLGHEVEKLGVQMITKESKARGFWNISMSLTLDPPALSGWPAIKPWGYKCNDWKDAPEDGQPWTYIFCSDELPEFCRIWLEISQYWRYGICFPDTIFYLDINPALGNGQATEIDSYPSDRSRVQKLLEPLRQLHSFGAAQIGGPLSGILKAEIITSVCRDRPFALEAIHTTIVFLEEADKKASKGQLRQAITGYKAALSCIRSYRWPGRHEHKIVMSDGPFPGLTAVQVVYNSIVRLQARIAAVYLESGKLRMARIYTERALDPSRTSHRGYMQYSLHLEPWQDVVFAEVLHVAAKISYTHGDVHKAERDLEKAGQFVPFDEEQKARHELWSAHAEKLDLRQQKRREAQRVERKKRIEKAEVMFQQVGNMKEKGDRLIRSGRSFLAISTFQTALRKLGLLEHDYNLSFRIRAIRFQGYCAKDAADALNFMLQAGLVAAHLMSQQYEEAIQLAELVLKCSCWSCMSRHDDHYCSRSYHTSSERRWAEDQRLDYQRIHLCKGMALKHMGKLKPAIEHLEKSQSFDPGNGTVHEQLALLKQAEAVAQKERLRAMNKLQNRLIAKQVRRRNKILKGKEWSQLS